MKDIQRTQGKHKINQTITKTQEDMNVEMRNFQIEIIGLNNLVGEMRNSLESLIIIVTAAMERISDVEDELRNTSTQ